MSITDDELESILGDVASEAEENLPDGEEPDDEDLENIEEDLGDIAEDAPGVSSEEVSGDASPGEDAPEDSAEQNDSDIEEEIDEDLSLDDFQGPTGDPQPSTAGPGSIMNQDIVSDDESLMDDLMQEAEKAGSSKEEASEGISILNQIEKNEAMKSQIGFQQADNIKAFIDQELWETFNCSSFGQFFDENDISMSRSAAYRYRNVALFMDDFPIGNEEWDNQFYEESGIEKKEVVNTETGEIDEARTREANNLQSRLNFTDVSEISSLYNNGHIDQAKARELLKKAIILPGSEFDEVVDMEKNNKDSTVTDELTNKGLVGPTFVVNAQNEEKAAEELRALADEIDAGREFSRPVLDGDEGVEKLGSKSVSFHELKDGTVIGDI